MRHSHGDPGSTGHRYEEPEFEAVLESERLIDLQIAVLDALESSGHPEFAAANTDRALRDNASHSERKAWLAIYGPLTNVQV